MSDASESRLSRGGRGSDAADEADDGTSGRGTDDTASAGPHGARHGAPSPGADALSGDPRVAEHLGSAFPAVEAFHRLLTEQGVLRGLIGPREVTRLWERHLLNSAALAPHLPTRGRLIDVGSGAGLPGVVLAAMLPAVEVVLLEPMERRTEWLTEVVERLGLDNAVVRRARAEEVHGELTAQAVTARAVAPLDRLARWTLPLLEPGGVLVALKGRQAADEITAARHVVRKLGGGPAEVLLAGTVPGLEPTTVVRIERVGHSRG